MARLLLMCHHHDSTAPAQTCTHCGFDYWVNTIYNLYFETRLTFVLALLAPGPGKFNVSLLVPPHKLANALFQGLVHVVAFLYNPVHVL